MFPVELKTNRSIPRSTMSGSETAISRPLVEPVGRTPSTLAQTGVPSSSVSRIVGVGSMGIRHDAREPMGNRSQ